MALSTQSGGRGTATPGRPRGAGQLGGLERPGRGPAHVQDDADAHRARSLRGVPAADSAGGDVHLSPLRGRGGHRAAHAGILPGVGGSASRPATRNRRERCPRGGRRGHAQGANGIQRRPFVLRASHAREGAGGARSGESARPVEGAAATSTTSTIPRTPRERSRAPRSVQQRNEEPGSSSRIGRPSLDVT
jgi:hypothetical protein